MKARRGCWTCKARRVQCDGRQPTCQRCVLAKRPCEGYQMRLSWPRDNDKKRAILAKSLARFTNEGHTRRDLFFINTAMRDIEIYRYLSPQSQPVVHPISGVSRHPQQEVNHTDLLHHFYTSAYLSLITFNATSCELRDVLTGLAQGGDTAPSRALFYALLAFSSRHQNGLTQQAIQLKIAALQWLAAPVQSDRLTELEAAKHVAASMVLGAFEILSPSDSSSEWISYVWGASDMVQAYSLEDQSHGGDIGILLDWVYYHHALCRFTQHHTRQRSSALEVTPGGGVDSSNVQYPARARERTALRCSNPTHAVLGLLTDICDTVVNPADPSTRGEEHVDRLKELEASLGSLSITPDTAVCDEATLLPVDLYDISTRIYLARASQSPWEPPTKLDSLVEMAFSVATSASTCKHFFPLFIVACEARTDERRAAILRLIQSNEKSGFIRSMDGLKAVIESIWVQQDLHVDDELLPNYLGIMSAAISSSDSFPSFV